MLGSLANNGGPTMTHLPQASSQAIDNGDPNYSGTLTTDQRGVPFVRVYNDGVNSARLDMGAVERQTQPLPASYFGDYNRNGVVDAADYVLWRKTFTTTVPSYSGADGDGSGIIGGQDETIWRRNFGQTEPSFGAGGGEQESAGGAIADSPIASGSSALVSDASHNRLGLQRIGNFMVAAPSGTGIDMKLESSEFSRLALQDTDRVLDDALATWLVSREECAAVDAESVHALAGEDTDDEAIDFAFDALNREIGELLAGIGS